METQIDVILTATDLRKTYERGPERVHALDGVSMTLGRGELVGLVGRSGSGKTTLLNVLAGWEEPDSGVVRYRDDGAAPDAVGWGRMAMLPQALGLIEELTVAKNIRLPARLGGHTHDLDDRIEELATELGLDELMDRLPEQTSIGQQQRCALARCLVLQPDLLLVDEPTGHQDAGWAARVWDVLRRASERGTCVLGATHSDEVLERADRMLAMADGRLTEVRDLLPQ